MKNIKVHVAPKLMRAMNLNSKKLQKEINKAMRASGIHAPVILVKNIDKQEKKK
jgi:hypothetical protein